MTVVTYRPLEEKLHSYGLSLGDGVGVGVEDIRERFAVRARRLRLNNVLRVFEAHAEKNQAVLRLLATDAAGAGEGVDLELENSGGKSLRGAKRGVTWCKDAHKFITAKRRTSASQTRRARFLQRSVSETRNTTV